MPGGDRDYLRTIQSCRQRGLRVSGHGGDIGRGDEKAFDGYVAAGMKDDHCIGLAQDILPRLRRSLKPFFIECSGRRGPLEKLLDGIAVLKLDDDRIYLCIDNITVIDMVEQGYSDRDSLLKIALDAGVPPVEVYRMVTLNVAEHDRVSDQIGSLSPGRRADILLLNSLKSFPPEIVLADGKNRRQKRQVTGRYPSARI